MNPERALTEAELDALNRMALFGADTSCDWMKRIACCQPSTSLKRLIR